MCLSYAIHKVSLCKTHYILISLPDILHRSIYFYTLWSSKERKFISQNLICIKHNNDDKFFYAMFSTEDIVV